jgi:hypothetical protein
MKRPLRSKEKIDNIMRALSNASEIEEDARFGERSRTSLGIHDVIRANRTAAEAKRMGLLPEEAINVDMEAVEASLHTLPPEDFEALHNLAQGMSIHEARPEPKLIPVTPAKPQSIGTLKGVEKRVGRSPMKKFFDLFIVEKKRRKPSGV